MRPNRGRTKTTVWLGDHEFQQIELIIGKQLATTKASAIRYALDKVNRPLPPTMDIGYRILKWAESLAFMSERERRQLRQFARELYELTGRRKP